MIRLDLSERDAIRLCAVIRSLSEAEREYLHDVEVMLGDEILTATAEEREIQRGEEAR